MTNVKMGRAKGTNGNQLAGRLSAVLWRFCSVPV
jgi:hypothetical protein